MIWRIFANKILLSRLLLFCLLSLASLGFSLSGQNAPIHVHEKGSPNASDGPAELPRVYVNSALSDTPAPGPSVAVNESDDLQEALDKVQCGETLKLQQGATFHGFFRFPAKSCDDAHWIIVRTAASDDALPPEGKRISPCYAGISSLPGRPDFHCVSDKNVMAKLEFDGKAGSGPVNFMPGANHYRLIGLDITRGSPGNSITALVFIKEKEATANHLIFDRVWIHGSAQDETARGIALRSMTYVAVVDSFLNDFHCVAGTGACGDSQTVVGGGGDDPEGPFKIVNNFLEASGENIMFGGGGATITPTDIEIRHNYLFKPMIWKAGTPGFVGGTSGHPFIVKNNFELKNAQRVLFEGNVLENNWGGFSQAGFAIVLTPKNQGNKCPPCQVTDITIRYNKVRSAGGVLAIGNNRSDAGGAALAGERYSIHDLTAQDVQDEKFSGFGLFALIIDSAPALRDVRIEHVTAFVPRGILSIQNTTGQKISNFIIANNIFYSAGPRQIASAGGGPANCAYKPDEQGPVGVFKSCFADAVVSHNLIVAGSDWPGGNIMVKDVAAAGLKMSSQGDIQEFHLCHEKDAANFCHKVSPALAAGSDGKDIGADIDRIDKATAGVR